MHRAISFVDCPIDLAIRVKAARVEPTPASIQEVKHRPDSVPEDFGLLWSESSPKHEYGISVQLPAVKAERTGNHDAGAFGSNWQMALLGSSGTPGRRRDGRDVDIAAPLWHIGASPAER